MIPVVTYPVKVRMFWTCEIHLEVNESEIRWTLSGGNYWESWKL